MDYSHWSDWWKHAANGFSPFLPQIFISPKPAESVNLQTPWKYLFSLLSKQNLMSNITRSLQPDNWEIQTTVQFQEEKLGGCLKERAIAINGTSSSCVIAAVKEGSAGKRRCKKVNSPAVIVTTAQSAGQKGCSRKEVSHTNCGRAYDHNNAG